MKELERSRQLTSFLCMFVFATTMLLGCATADAAHATPEDPFATGRKAPTEQVEAKSAPREGRVVEGPRNITSFNPEHETVEVDAEAISLRQVLEDLGPVATEWYQHVHTLANPFFEGRVPGTRGKQLATEYLEFWFREYGLDPAFLANSNDDVGGNPQYDEWVSYRQPFEFRAMGRRVTVSVDEPMAAINSRRLEADEEFRHLGVSGNGHVTAPVTFVGYGIERGEDGYTSFDNDTDLTGRIALLLRYEPLDEDGRSKWADRRFSSHSKIAGKLAAVRNRGAAGIILVNPPGSRDGATGLDQMRRSARFGSPLPVPAIQMSIEAADELIRAADADGRDLNTLRQLADTGEVRSIDLRDDVRITIAGNVEREGGDGVVQADNVGGVLRGKGDLADEWIVIGAHYDHLGYGSFGTSPQYRGQLHPGADDNASGTAGLIILARTLHEAYEQAGEDDHLRSILFIAFSAEESGLHGSRHYVNNATVQHENIMLMINMDMIGRLRGGNLSVLGVGTAERLQELLDPHFIDSGLTVSVTAGSSGRSDDANFIRADIPAVHFFTGVHGQYHAPSDRAHKVNPAGARDILRLIHRITLDFALRPDGLAFTEPRREQRTEDRGYGPVRLGIRPGMGEAVERGVYVDGVSANTSADDAGMQSGDIIIGWDDVPIDDMRSLFESLQRHEPGDVVNITVLRDDEEVILEVTLKAGEG